MSPLMSGDVPSRHSTVYRKFKIGLAYVKMDINI